MAAILAMAPALLGTAGGVMNMVNGPPAGRVQPGMNPMQFVGNLFQPAVSQGYGQVAGAPNPYADTLGQFGQIAQSLINNPGAGTMVGGANAAAGLGAGAAGNMAGLGDFLARMGQGLTPWAGNMLQQGSVQNPNAGSMMQGAQSAANLGQGAVGNMLGTGGLMQGTGQSLLPFVPEAIRQGFTQNSNTGSMMQGAQSAAGLGAGAAGNMLGTGSLMQGTGQGLLPYASNALDQGLMQNPNAGSLMHSAQGAAGMGQGVAGNMFGTGAGLERTGQNLMPYAGSILNTSFDPQNALYDRTRQQTQEQVRAGQSARGLGMSPFGAGLENKAMSDFNIDWQNNQLGRMATGAGAAGNLAGQSGNLQTAGAGLMGQAPGMLSATGMLPYQAGGTILSDILRNTGTGAQNASSILNPAASYLTSGAGMIGQAPGMMSQSSQLPYQAGQTSISDTLRNTGAGAQNAGAFLNPAASYLTGGAGMINQAPGMMSQSSQLPYQAGQTSLGDILRNMLSGAQGAGMLLDQSGRDITGGASLMGQAPGMMSSASMLPYQAFNTIGQTGLGALQQFGQQGMAATQQPQQQLQDFYQMMGIGNQGAQVGNNIFGNQLNQANMGFNQGRQQGQDFGNAMAMFGRGMNGGNNGGGNAFMPTQAFMNNNWGWG